MSSQHTETVDEKTSSGQPTATYVRSTLENRSRDGSLTMLAGGASLASALAAIRTNEDKGRATMLALAGVGLVGLGVRQRRSERGEDIVETGADARRDEDGKKRVSDDAYTETERDLGAERNANESASVSQSETEPNPRGMTDRSDVETDEEGDPRFVEGEQGGPHRETHLEDETAHDTRLHPERDDEPTEIDLSEAAMADEASEATGPHPEQAYPAREGTDPEPTSEAAPERVGEGAVASADSSGEERETDGENRESESESDDASQANDESK